MDGLYEWGIRWSQKSFSLQLDCLQKMLIGQVSLLFVFSNNGYILGPAAGQEDSGSPWPLYWFSVILLSISQDFGMNNQGLTGMKM